MATEARTGKPPAPDRQRGRPSRWQRMLLIPAVALSLLPTAAGAIEPVTMFLMKMLGEAAFNSIREAEAERRSAPPPAHLLPGYPGIGERSVTAPRSEEELLRQTISESFFHLSGQEREQVYASLRRILDDPAHASERRRILDEFLARAAEFRSSNRELSRLTDAHKRLIAVEARTEFSRLDTERQRAIIEAMQRGIPSLPRDLSDLVLAEFRSVHAESMRAGSPR